eukprot:gene8191-11081_t
MSRNRPQQQPVSYFGNLDSNNLRTSKMSLSNIFSNMGLSTTWKKKSSGVQAEPNYGNGTSNGYQHSTNSKSSVNNKSDIDYTLSVKQRQQLKTNTQNNYNTTNYPINDYKDRDLQNVSSNKITKKSNSNTKLTIPGINNIMNSNVMSTNQNPRPIINRSAISPASVEKEKPITSSSNKVTDQTKQQIQQTDIDNNLNVNNNSKNNSINNKINNSNNAKPLCCDKCDGKHETDNCPYFKKKREDHPDAQKKSANQIGGTSLLPGSYLNNARVVRQPGDGSCLFHSMTYGLKNNSTASRLRSEICSFIQNNPTLKISDTPLKDWVKWDSGLSCVDYARNMSRSAWGGGIEMACVSQLKGCNVHVYERHGLGFKRISAFDHPDSPELRPIVRVLYCGGVHYDALVTN